MARPSASTLINTWAAEGLVTRSGVTLRPLSSTAWKYLPSMRTCCGSSRASTVLGCVPAATRIVRAGRTTSRGAADGSSWAWERRSARGAEAVEQHLLRRQPLGEADPFLQRFAHLLVVERIARRIDQAAAIDDRGATPSAHELGEPRLAAFARRQRALGANLSRVLHELGCGFRFLRGPVGTQRGFPALGGERFVSAEELLYLQRIISERLGRGVDGGEAAADDDDRQSYLQIGQAVGLGGAGELQRH